jgi:thiol-disulfide isomerase/thioredoxin
MPARPNLLRVLTLGALLSCAGTVVAAPPTDAQIDAYVTAFNEAGKDNPDRAAVARAKQDAAAKGLADLSLGEATLAQIEKLADARILSFPAVKEAVAARLTELAKAEGVAGARAAELRAANLPGDRRKPEYADAAADALIAAVSHKSFADLLKSGKGETVFRSLAQIPAKSIADKKILEAVEPFITADLSPLGVSSFRGLISVMGDDESRDLFSSELRERVRTRIVAAAKGVIEKNASAEGPAAQQLKSVKDTLALADGAWAKGTLIGNPAPDIAFTWVSDSGTQKSFADFKGKVVMIDFWATWCGPCRAVFPKMAQLADRYKGHDVVILGLTSLQGFHIDENNKRIDTKDDPAKETALMPDFMKAMGVNWTIAFGDKSCFNPDFGVQGIPHVAIIDAKGVVRYNGLYPNPVEESEKIDALLKEAGLNAPEKPFEPTAPAKK